MLAAVPVAEAAASGVVAVPGSEGLEFEAAVGVGAGQNGVGDGFWDALRMRLNAFCTHIGRHSKEG